MKIKQAMNYVPVAVTGVTVESDNPLMLPFWESLWKLAWKRDISHSSRSLCCLIIGIEFIRQNSKSIISVCTLK